MYIRASESIERARDGLEPGTFRLTLASSGEASDGHILSIEGADLPERLPLLLSHENDPRSQVGTLDRFTRHLRETPEKLRGVGQIELGGEGVAADLRRDLALMIERGHVRGVSVRWDPIDAIPRIDLPDGHPARVDESEPDQRKRYGLFFSKWRALEGSIVSIGADEQAVIGRAKDTTGTLADFWARFIRPPATPLEGAMRILAGAADHARANGCADEDVLNAVWKAARLSLDPETLSEFVFGDRKIMIPARAELEILRREVRALREVPPAPRAEQPVVVSAPFPDTFALLREVLAESDQAMLGRLRAEYGHLRGRLE